VFYFAIYRNLCTFAPQKKESYEKRQITGNIIIIVLQRPSGDGTAGSVLHGGCWLAQKLFD
jgi:hypothetical protein